MEPIYLTIPQAAELMNLSDTTIARMVKAGEMPGVKRFGTAVRIHRETLESWARDEAAIDQEINGIIKMKKLRG